MHPRQQVSSLMAQPYCGWFTGQHKQQSNTSLAMFLSYVMGKIKDADVYLIFERYEYYSIKGVIRIALGKEASRHHQLSQSMHLPPQKVVLHVKYNKIQLIDMETQLSQKQQLASTNHKLVLP